MRIITRLISASLVPVFIAIVLVVSACGQVEVPAVELQSVPSPFASFRDIPGVTAEEIAAIEALQKTHTSFDYGMTLTTEAFKDENGQVNGYAALICEWMTGLFGIRFRPEIYAWNDLLNSLNDAELDFAGTLIMSDERKLVYHMTDAIAERMYKIMRLKGSPPLDEIAKTRLPRYSFLADAVHSEYVAAVTAPGSYESVWVNDYAEVHDVLKRGEADAFIAIGVAEASLVAYDDIQLEDFLPLIYNPVAISTAKPEFAPIISVIDKALHGGALPYLNYLYSQGYEAYRKYKFSILLSDKEKEYLRNTVSVPLVYQYYNYPVAFYDTRHKKWDGISIDILHEVEKFTGFSFEIINKENTEMPELIEMLSDGRAHIFTDLIFTKERESRFIWNENKFMTDQYALLSKVDYPNVSTHEIPNKRISLIRGLAHEEMFHAWFPDALYATQYANSDEAFRALERDEVDLVMVSKSSLLWYSNYYEFSGYKANYLFNYFYDSAFAFNKDQTILCSIVDKALSVIETTMITEQWLSKTYDFRARLLAAQRPWLIGAIILALAVLGLILVLFLRGRDEGKRLVKEVSRKTSTLTALLDATPDLIFFKDSDLRHTECNKSFENHLKINKSDLIGKNDAEAFGFPLGLLEHYEAKDKKVINEKYVSIIEEIIPSADGRKLFFETIKSPIIQDGEATGLVGISRDITQRKAAEENLNKQNSLMSTVNAAAAILLEPDTDGGFDAIKHSMEMVCQSVDADRVYVWQITHKDDGRLYYKKICKWIRAGNIMDNSLLEVSYDDTMPFSKSLLLEGKSVNGPVDTLPETDRKFFSSLDVQSVLIVPLSFKGELWGTVSFDDCHSRRFFPESDEHILRSWGLLVVGAIQRENIMRDLEYAMREAMKAYGEAEAANRAKSSFLTSMSHEIRTPMNAILGITEILLQNELPKETKNSLDIIYNSGYSLLEIINDLLDLSKIEAGKLELTNNRYETASLINDTINLNTARIGSKPLEFKLYVDEDIPFELIGDELRIKQILNNLLSNAIKYTDSGEVGLSFHSEIVSTENADGENGPSVMLTIVVRDTGQGMTEEQVQTMFDAYSRFNMAENRFVEGTGLGMNIVQNLVKMMGKDISVNSIPGKGTEVTVHLAQGYVGPAMMGRELAENLMSFRMAGMSKIKKAQIVREYMPYGRVLVVDDMETNLYVARGFLLSYGLTVDTALSGMEAIQKIERGEVYDIVFMDHMMPVMDGIEAVKTIRAKGYTHPVVVLTANAVSGQADKFLANGFDGFISKPIDIRELNASLIKFVRDRQSAKVVEAAHAISKGGVVNSSETRQVDPELAKIFTHDAEKAIVVLQEYGARSSYEGENLQPYIINVHALKSALANIGELQLSALAKELEQAGEVQNTAFISDKTPSFLKELRVLVDKLMSDKAEYIVGEASEEELDYLRRMLFTIKEACASYDVDTAMTALTEIKQKPWPREYGELLDTVSGHLLHSDFDETEALCAAWLNKV